jgi:hypothetical protein
MGQDFKVQFGVVKTGKNYEYMYSKRLYIRSFHVPIFGLLQHVLDFLVLLTYIYNGSKSMQREIGFL